MNINAILTSTTNPAFQCYVEDGGEVIYTDDGELLTFYVKSSSNKGRLTMH